MEVTFRKTGERRYAVVVQAEGKGPHTVDPAPGFDPHIPHDLVHYVVEAELSLAGGVYGRAASGGGTFYSAGATPGGQTPRERARERRKQSRREQQLRRDEQAEQEMQLSERLAGVCDVLWRRRRGQRPDATRAAPQLTLSAAEQERALRVVDRLDQLAPRWSELPLGGELTFVWPSLVPR